jgi:hypothetical protein
MMLFGTPGLRSALLPSSGRFVPRTLCAARRFPLRESRVEEDQEILLLFESGFDIRERFIVLKHPGWLRAGSDPDVPISVSLPDVSLDHLQRNAAWVVLAELLPHELRDLLLSHR